MPGQTIDIGVLVSGSGTNLQSIIDSVEAGRLDARIKLVLSDTPGVKALERAEEHSIPTAVVTKAKFPGRDEFDKKVVGILKEHGVELVCLAGFMRLISPAFLSAFPMKIINIHPSLLPSFPGLDVQKKTIEHGAKISGCTVHFVDEGLDSGPIIIQSAVPVLDGDTVEALKERILAEEHRIYPEAIQFFAEGRIKVDGRKVSVEHTTSGGALRNPSLTVSEGD